MIKLLKQLWGAATCIRCGQTIPGSVSGAASICSKCSDRK